MNIQDYISSGILESYILGELSDKDRKEVESLALTYPEIKAELEAIEIAQEKFLQHQAITPPSHVRESLLNKIADREPMAKVVSLQSTNSSSVFWKYATAASFTLALVSGFFAFRYAGELEEARELLSNYMVMNQQFAQDYNQVNQQLEEIVQEVDIISNPRYQRIALAGTDNAPNALATVYWHGETEELFLKIQSMQSLAADQQYQLWAIIDGNPVDAGVFDANSPGLLTMKNIGKGAVAFAVTIEPRGGKPSPTLETMQVLGAVPAQG